jgi:hypothetical protein
MAHRWWLWYCPDCRKDGYIDIPFDMKVRCGTCERTFLGWMRRAGLDPKNLFVPPVSDTQCPRP